jgi:hypothetical protein
VIFYSDLICGCPASQKGKVCRLFGFYFVVCWDLKEELLGLGVRVKCRVRTLVWGIGCGREHRDWRGCFGESPLIM